MISVVILTLNSAAGLPETLSALVPPALDGFVKQVIVIDGGSTDETTTIADLAGADIVIGEKRRAQRLVLGTARARFPWLLFLNPGTILEDGWDAAAFKFIRDVDCGDRPAQAAAFTLSLDGNGFATRLTEHAERLRSAMFGDARGERGLLISKSLLHAMGGYRDSAEDADADLARRLGRARLARLDTKAHVPVELFRRRRSERMTISPAIKMPLSAVALPLRLLSRLSRAS